jgi:tyrosinase
MPAADRKDYTRAVNCLMNMPSRYNKTEFPGARSRFDDYVAFHISVTLIHHGSVQAVSIYKHTSISNISVVQLPSIP